MRKNHGFTNTWRPFINKWRIGCLDLCFHLSLPAMSIYIACIAADSYLRSVVKTIWPHVSLYHNLLFYLGLFIWWWFKIWNVIKLFVSSGRRRPLLTAIINLRYKISAHMGGHGRISPGALISMSFWSSLTSFLHCRHSDSRNHRYRQIDIEEHKPPQLYGFFALGLGVQTFMFYLLQNSRLSEPHSFHNRNHRHGWKPYA